MVKQNSFNPYPNEMLPIGFNYPKNYLKLAKSTYTINYDKEYIFPWWFEDYGPEGALLSYELRNSQILGSNLIPFAQNGCWKAYFDANDISNNPKVIVIDLDNTENYEIFNNFDEWLKEAENDGW